MKQPGAGIVAELALPALERAEDGVALLDGGQDGAPICWLNGAFESMSGYARAELEGKSLQMLYRGDRDQPGVAELLQALQDGAGVSTLLRCYRPGGSLYWCRLRLESVQATDGRRWWIAYARDVSAQREMERLLGRRTEEVELVRRRLEEPGAVDRLTGLHNEEAFALSLELAWFSCARDRRPLALFLFAPDHFGIYMETFGRVTGDSCLRMVAHAVGSAFRRESDVSARVADAQFAALGVGMPVEFLEAHARRVCDRVRALAIRNPRAPRASEITLSAVVLHFLPSPGSGWRELLETGRALLSAAQASGVEQVVLQVDDAARDASGAGAIPAD